MKSGSLRAIPGPPNSTTACGTSSGTTTRRPRPCGTTGATGAEVGFRRQRAEGAVDELAGGLGVDVADDGDLEHCRARACAGYRICRSSMVMFGTDSSVPFTGRP